MARRRKAAADNAAAKEALALLVDEVAEADVVTAALKDEECAAALGSFGEERLERLFWRREHLRLARAVREAARAGALGPEAVRHLLPGDDGDRDAFAHLAGLPNPGRERFRQGLERLGTLALARELDFELERQRNDAEAARRRLREVVAGASEELVFFARDLPAGLRGALADRCGATAYLLEPGRPLAGLLDETHALLTRYVVFPDPHQAVAVTLWVACTWVFPQFDVAPYLAVTSPDKRCGKTRLLEVLALLVREPWPVVQPTEAVLYRKVERDHPTLLLDEADAIFRGPATPATEGLRAVLNAGHRRGATVPRCVGEEHELREFDVFCPKAIAGIRELPATVADRAIAVRLQRKRKGDRVERLRQGDPPPEFAVLRRQLAAWARTFVPPREVAVPAGLDDRAEDCWRPLLAVAEAAGDGWPERARAAALALQGAREQDDETTGRRLLADVREVFAELGRDELPATQLLERLRELPESPWADGGGLSGRRLANLLKPYGIRSRHKEHGNVYRRADFADAWARYLGEGAPEAHEPPPSGVEASFLQPGQESPAKAGETGRAQSFSPEGCLKDWKVPICREDEGMKLSTPRGAAIAAGGAPGALADGLPPGNGGGAAVPVATGEPAGDDGLPPALEGVV